LKVSTISFACFSASSSARLSAISAPSILLTVATCYSNQQSPARLPISPCLHHTSVSRSLHQVPYYFTTLLHRGAAVNISIPIHAQGQQEGTRITHIPCPMTNPNPLAPPVTTPTLPCNENVANTFTPARSAPEMSPEEESSPDVGYSTVMASSVRA
jgi:hypothetical protein